MKQARPETWKVVALFGFEGTFNRERFCGNAGAADAARDFKRGPVPPPLRIPTALRGGREFRSEVSSGLSDMRL